jgi:hypothetical protein
MFSCLLSKSNRFYAIHIVSFELELTSYIQTLLNNIPMHHKTRFMMT